MEEEIAESRDQVKLLKFEEKSKNTAEEDENGNLVTVFVDSPSRDVKM